MLGAGDMETNVLRELSHWRNGIGQRALVLNVTDMCREGRLMAPKQAEGWAVLGELTEAVHTVLWRMTGWCQNIEGIVCCAENYGLYPPVEGKL